MSVTYNLSETLDTVSEKEILLSAEVELIDEEPKAVEKKKTVHKAHAPLDPIVEATVKTYFADTPIMIEIARCESRYRHYDVEGEALHGYVNHSDRGVMQINEHYHDKTAVKLGLDIRTLEGNLAYARYLYDTQGTRPWKSSSPCWGSHVALTLQTKEVAQASPVSSQVD